MRKVLIALAVLAAPLAAEEPAKPATLAPSEIAAAAPKVDWAAIASSDLLVMDLAPDAKGKARRVVIQLMPPPFSQGWIGNIRKLAAAHWWDGLSVNRVQDNYVVQWGDAAAEDKAKAKALLAGLVMVPQNAYTIPIDGVMNADLATLLAAIGDQPGADPSPCMWSKSLGDYECLPVSGDEHLYAYLERFYKGWLYASDYERAWPVHCYAMVGVGRDMPPSTGSGAELYTVIGHAPRHLDRNIALVGRVIEGIEHLSSLPRGTGALGFYETAEERVKIRAIRLGSEVNSLPTYEYLSTESASFAHYANARANRRDPFFIQPAGGADICNIPVPVRRAAK